MPDDVSGRLGDLSGRVGDLSGRVGDLSGRVGDLSGRVGDLSGKTLEQVHGIVLQDRQLERVDCLEGRVRRLESEILTIAEWIDARLQILEANVPEELAQILSLINQHITTLDRGIAGLNQKATSFQDSLNKLEERVKRLEPHP